MLAQGDVQAVDAKNKTDSKVLDYIKTILSFPYEGW